MSETPRQEEFSPEPEKQSEPVLETEKKLSPEVIGKIMDKVQDIDTKGTAYHALLEGDGTLANILKDGLLGQKLNRNKISILGRSLKDEEKEKLSFGKAWAKLVHETKRGFVHFNIVGRNRVSDTDQDYGFSHYREVLGTGTEIGDSRWIKYNRSKITIIFDISNYQELLPKFHENILSK